MRFKNKLILLTTLITLSSCCIQVPTEEQGNNGEDCKDLLHYVEMFFVNFHPNDGQLPSEFGLEESKIVTRRYTRELSEPTRYRLNFIYWFEGDYVNSKQLFLNDSVFVNLYIYSGYKETEYPIAKIKHGVARSNIRKVTNLELINNFKGIKYSNFANYKYLLNVNFVKGLGKVESDIFANDLIVTTLEIPNRIVSIAYEVFRNSLKLLHIEKIYLSLIL